MFFKLATESIETSNEGETKNLFFEAAMLCCLVLFVLSVGGLMKKHKFHYFGETAMCMMTGLIVGLLFMWFTHSEFNESILDKDIQLSADFFYMVLLPPIIFEAGFTLQRMTFFKNIVLILSLAFVGAFYSCIVTSGMMWIFSRFTYKLTMIEALVFGSLISSTDPVTILAMLPESVDKRLYMLIFGESALNDAVSIILYRFFTSIADPHMDLGIVAFLMSMLNAVAVFWGSVSVGMVIALSYAKLTKHSRMPDGSVYELAMLLVFSYMSYLLAELWHMTGIISVFFCGAAISHYAYNNLSEVTILSAKMCLRTLSVICESFIFLYLGLGLVAFGEQRTTYHVWFILSALVSILVARSHIFFICGANNILSPLNHIPFKHMIFMWFGGLRGAVAFALAVQLLDNSFFSIETRSMLFGTTLIVVFITVVVLGGLTPFVLKKLGLDGKSTAWEEVGDEEEGESKESSSKELEKGGKDHFEEILDEKQDVHDVKDLKPAFVWLHSFDQKYIKPFFSNEQSARAQRLGLAVDEEEEEEAVEAIAAVTLPGMAGITRQGSARDVGPTASGTVTGVDRRESNTSVRSGGKVASRRESILSGIEKKEAGGVGKGDDGFEEIQMTVVAKENN